MVDVQQILPAAIGDVVCPPGSVGSGGAGLQVRLNDVLDIGEVAALPPVPVDGGALPLQQLPDELGDDGGIRPFGILPAPEYVKVPQTIGVKAIVLCVLLCPFLVRPL